MNNQLPISHYYSGGTIFNFSDGEDFLAPKNLPEYISDETDKIHIVAEWDTLDLLAFRYYGDSKLFWLIAHANKIEDPFYDLTAMLGSSIFIPDWPNFQVRYLR